MHNEVNVSVILPCYNEAQFIESTVDTIQNLLDMTKYCYEIIICDDGSIDGSKAIAEKLASKDLRIRFMKNNVNCGRGKTVSNGIQAARGRTVGYIDLDLEIPAVFILPAILAVEKGADIAVADRLSVLNSSGLSIVDRIVGLPYYMFRGLMTIVYCQVLRITLGHSIYPEAGMKFYNREKILPLLNQVKDERWFWDTELITRAYYAGMNIKGIECLAIRNAEKESTVNIVKDTIYYLREIYKLRRLVKQWQKLKKGAVNNENSSS